MARKKDVTIRLIADECGVSTATVSRVINCDPKVSEATRRKVTDSLIKNNYVIPDTEKKPSASVPKIGVILTAVNVSYYNSLLDHITMHFLDQGICTITCNTDRRAGALPRAIEALYTSGVSGIIFISSDYNSIESLLRPDIPSVWIDCNDSGPDVKNICQVQSDQYASGQLAAQELINSGCRKPIIITGVDLSHRSRSRIAGFRNIFEKSGITFQDDQLILLPTIQHPFTECRDMVQYLITKAFSFDGIFASNDWRALGAVIAVQNSGIKMPDQIRIIGFDGISIAANSILRITSIQQNTALLARNACDLLEKQQRKEDIPVKSIIVPPHLVVGQTT